MKMVNRSLFFINIVEIVKRTLLSLKPGGRQSGQVVKEGTATTVEIQIEIRGRMPCLHFLANRLNNTNSVYNLEDKPGN